MIILTDLKGTSIHNYVINLTNDTQKIHTVLSVLQFLYQWNWQPGYNGNIVKTGIKAINSGDFEGNTGSISYSVTRSL